MKNNLLKQVSFIVSAWLLSFATKADVIDEEPQTLTETTLFLVSVLVLVALFGLWIVKKNKKAKKEQ